MSLSPSGEINEKWVTVDSSLNAKKKRNHGHVIKSVGRVLIYSELSRKTSLKKGNFSWNLNDKESIAKQQSWRKTIAHRKTSIEDPEARMNLVYSQNRKEGWDAAGVLWLGLRMATDKISSKCYSHFRVISWKDKNKTVTKELLRQTHFWTSNNHFKRKEKHELKKCPKDIGVWTTKNQQQSPGSTSAVSHSESNSVLSKINVSDCHIWMRGYLKLMKEMLKHRTHKWTQDRNEYFWMCLS